MVDNSHLDCKSMDVRPMNTSSRVGAMNHSQCPLHVGLLVDAESGGDIRHIINM